jgi:predicted nucleotidyltransferase
MERKIDTQLNEFVFQAAKILQSYGALEVYAFGSATNGTANSTSDIDLAVRGIPPVNFYSAVGETLCTIERNVDIIDLDGDTAFGKYLIEHSELTRVL